MYGALAAAQEIHCCSNEIGVEVLQEYVVDLERVFGANAKYWSVSGCGSTTGCRACRLGQTRQIGLLKDYAALSRAFSPFGWGTMRR